VLWLLVLLQGASPEPAALRVRPGAITEGIRCRGAPQFSYELYVPSGFKPDRAWPVLYVFDPRGRGRLGAELFRDGAEARGYLIVSSNDTESDNPEAPNGPVVNALWSDTHQRLPIDPKRRYAAGFSGGARLASRLGLALKGDLAGILAAGGGFAPGQPPVRDLPFAVFASTGLTDFNYYEMRRLAASLEKLAARYRLEVFDGGHDWPPAALATACLEWFDVAAMRAGSLARDPNLLGSVFAREMSRAEELEASGKRVEADELLAALVRDLEGLYDTEAADARRSSLGPRVKQERRRREKLDQRDVAINARNDQVITRVVAGDELPALGRVLHDLDVARLLEEARRADYDGASARRRLAHIEVQTSFYQPRELMARGEWRRAIVVLQVATTVDPESAFAHWQLARAHARRGSRREALGALEKAVDLGLRLPRARVEAEADLSSLREDPAFGRVLSRLPD